MWLNICHRGNISTIFSTNSEADALKLVENLEEMLLILYLLILLVNGMLTNDNKIYSSENLTGL